MFVSFGKHRWKLKKLKSVVRICDKGYLRFWYILLGRFLAMESSRKCFLHFYVLAAFSLLPLYLIGVVLLLKIILSAILLTVCAVAPTFYFRYLLSRCRTQPLRMLYCINKPYTAKAVSF